MLSVATANQNLSFIGKKQIHILQYHVGSYTVDAADDRDHSAYYNNVQFEVLDQEHFDTTVSIAKVSGCTREATQFKMHCTSQNVVF
jgi:hypothetical protein